MARNKSFMRFEGTVGGLVFYVLNGVPTVRTCPKVSKERRDTDPAYARVREGNKEFGGCSRASSGFKMAFGGVLKMCGKGSIGAYNAAVMRKILNLGEGVLGKREINVREHGWLLKGFELNRELPFGSVFAGAPAPVITGSRNTLRWTVPDFDTRKQVKAPAGATHFMLVLAGGYVSNYTYDANINEYGPVHAAVNGQGGVAFSDAIAVGGMSGGEIVLDIDLSSVGEVPESCALVGGCGIVFFQVVNGELYSLKSGNCMMVAVVG